MNARLLIERGADVNARNWMGQTALLTAHGADPNTRDKEGRTALFAASALCQYWNIKALLAHGADPSIRDNRGRTALEPGNFVAPADPKCAVCRRLLHEAVWRIPAGK